MNVVETERTELPATMDSAETGSGLSGIDLAAFRSYPPVANTCAW